VFPDLLTFYFVGSGSNALIRATAFEDSGKFDESLKAMEDWDLFLRLAANHQFVTVPKAQVLYRITNDSLSSHVVCVESEMLKVVERVYGQEPGKSYTRLKRLTFSSLYLFLASRALKGLPNRQNGMLAAGFIWKSFANHPGVLREFTYFSTLLFKSATAILLPAKLAQLSRLLAKAVAERVSLSVAEEQRS
jgi:hypothetical protein